MNQHFSALLAALALSTGLPAVAVANQTAGIPLGAPLRAASATAATAETPKDVLLRVVRAHGARAAADIRRSTSAAAGHFNLPWALATDNNGNVFVANYGNDSIEVISASALSVKTAFSSSSILYPVSLAVDQFENVFVGSVIGGVTKFSASGAVLQTISANASRPVAIAVDGFEDLYIASSSYVAIDDANGNSVFPLGLPVGEPVSSVTIAGPEIYAFANGVLLTNNGEAALTDNFRGWQHDFLPYGVAPTGSACTKAFGICWFDDSQHNTLTTIATNGIPGNGGNGGNGVQTGLSLSYVPAGIAYDAPTNRLFVADGANDAIEVYNATSLALEKKLL